MTLKITQADVLDTLRKINLPNPNGNAAADIVTNIVDAGMVSSIVVRDESIGFALEINESDMSPETADALRIQAENQVKKTFAPIKVTAVLTAQRTEASPQRQAREAFKQQQKASVTAPQPIKGVKHIIAVASGKGGVGKSTISVNLAVALAAQGKRVAIVDADIYGPSVPHMLGINQKPEINADNKMVPIEAHGLHAISIGCLIDRDKATVWRGPMVIKAMFQLFKGTEWNDIDYMIVDMPPGTGDIQLSMATNIPLSGAILVTTPQEVALLDVRKAADMFEKVKVPLLGVVENMSYYDHGDGVPLYLFGEGGGKRIATTFNIPLLGEIPLRPLYREAGDAGKPLKKQTKFDEIALKCAEMAL